MSSVRDLKRNINNVLGDLIESAYLVQIARSEVKPEKVESIVDEAITHFDTLIDKVNQKDIENKKAHFTAVRKDLESVANGLVEKINKLS